VVATLRHPSEVRPGVSIEMLVNETLTQFEGIPDDIADEALDAWVLNRLTQPAPTPEPSTAPWRSPARRVRA
jgi:hypothetical protein